MSKRSTIGTLAYRNLLAVRGGQPSEIAEEVPCYTDAEIRGAAGYGPFHLLNPVRMDMVPEVPAVVLRVEYHLPRVDLTKPEGKVGNEHYHGGTMSDEVAALTSLELGIRLKAGAPNRRFQVDEDARGSPLSHGRFGREEPKAPGQIEEPVIPSLQRPVYLETELLSRLLALGPHGSVVLTRCARLYQDAIWIADSTPELSWLLLVSAVEAAANHWQAKSGDPYDRVSSSDNPLVQAIREEEGGEERLRRLAPHIAAFTGAWKKFAGFLLEFGPHESAEPAEEESPFFDWSRLNWSPEGLEGVYKQVYSLRSNALHAGNPFPLPMCLSPRIFLQSGEVPMVTGALGATWERKETPILLSAFERIAREAIVNYFLSRTD